MSETWESNISDSWPAGSPQTNHFNNFIPIGSGVALTSIILPNKGIECNVVANSANFGVAMIVKNLIPGQTYQVDVNANITGSLSSGSLMFQHYKVVDPAIPTLNIFSNTMAVNGNNSITFIADSTSACFRFFTTGTASSTGSYTINLSKTVLSTVAYNLVTVNIPLSSEGDEYRFAFNGAEKDNEMKGSGNSLDYGERVYDTRFGMWLSPDPLEKEYPSLSPYAFCEGNPIEMMDEEGETGLSSSKRTSDAVHLGLDLIGMIPMFGEVADGANALIYLAEGNYKEAAISAAAMVPLAGSVVGAAKLIRRVDKAVTSTKGISKVVSNANTVIANTKTVVNKVVKAAPPPKAPPRIISNLPKLPAKKPTVPTAPKTPAVPNKGGCFVAGTLVLTANGLQAIETVKVGDTVWAYNNSDNIVQKQVVLKTILRTTYSLITFTINNKSITTTAEHPFYINNQWIEARDVKIGDSVQLFNGQKIAVAYKSIKDTTSAVYNFSVSNYHNYYVSDIGVLVHNATQCITPPSNPPKAVVNANSKRAAFRQAKRDVGIPTSQTHIKHKKVASDGYEVAAKKKNGTEYTFENGKTIQHHPKGHPKQNVPEPHFNNHQPEGAPRGTKNHYIYPSKK
jgi:RHS repeat-associated protein